MTKIFIGMPVYNGEKFIRYALDSLIAQSFEDWQLLIADNSSTDLTSNICQEYIEKDKRISYVRHDKNHGPEFNFKYVLSHADSEFFLWAAYDDIWESAFLGECLELLIQNPLKSVAFSKMLNVDTYNRPYRDEKGFESFSIDPSCKLVSNYILQHEVFGKANIICGLYRTNIIKDVMALRWNFSRAGCDCMINLAVLARGGLALSDKVLFRKRNARSTDTREKIDFVTIDFSHPRKYEHVGIVDYFLPNAFVALRGTRYLKCLYWALPIRFIRIYSAVWLSSLRGWVVNQRRLIK